jgi:hypothetical protein
MVQTTPPSGPPMPSSRTPVMGDPMQQLLAMKSNRGQPIPEQVPPIPPQQLQQMGQMPPPMSPPSEEEVSLNKRLKGKLADMAALQLANNAIGEDIQREAEEQDELQKIAMMNNLAIQDIARSAINPTMAMESGGLIRLAEGGNFSGQVPGQGHGMEDNVYMPIVERQKGKQVATLAVSPDEYVVDAHTMSALGNGSADAGAKVMDKAIKDIRQQAYGTTKQPNEISGLAALKPLIERV